MGYPMISIAKKEFMDNIRNLWFVFLSLLFIMLTISGSFASRYLSFSDLSIFVRLLVPLISLMLGYDTIIGEIRKGSMSSLLTSPVTRDDVILGKIIGLSSVIGLTILIGFGITGINLAIRKITIDAGFYVLFIGITVLLGMAFLSVVILFSAWLKNRSTVLATVIFLWFFFTLFWDLLAYYAIQKFPDIKHSIQLLNPYGAYNDLIQTYTYSTNHDISVMCIVSLILWILLPLLASFFIFRKREI